MKNITWNTKILSLILMLTLLVGIVPMNGIVSYAVDASESQSELSEEESTGAVSVTVDGETKYYSSLVNAIDNSVDGAVITLNDDLYENGVLHNIRNDITIDLNSFDIGGISFRVYGNLTVKDSSADRSGRVKPNSGVCVFNIYSSTDGNGSLTIESGNFDIHSISIDEGCSLVITGGIFEEYIQFSDAFSDVMGSVSISGGTFHNGVYNREGDISYLLADGYAFKDEDSNLVDGTADYFEKWITVVLHECSFNSYVAVEDKHAVSCIYCGKMSDELFDHVPSDEVYCAGTVCADCGVCFGEETSDVHFDNDSDDRCDFCRVFLGKIISEVTGKFVVRYETTDGKNAYIEFTVTEAGSYHFYSDLTEGDPVGALYTTDFNCLADNDDSDNYMGRNFEFEVYLEPGVYYLCIYPLGGVLSADIIGRKLCDTHVGEGDPTCAGIICSVCGDTFGEVDENNHVPSDVQRCLGYLCDLCGEYFGEGSDDNHLDDNDDRLCDLCGDDFIDADVVGTNIISAHFATETYEIKFIKLIVTVAGKYEIYSLRNSGDPKAWLYDSNIQLLAYNDDSYGLDFCIERELDVGVYFIEVKGVSNQYDVMVYANLKCDTHTSSGQTNCLGTLCSACLRYYGEKNDNHVFSGEQTCKGYFCSVCETYYGELGDNHVFEGEQVCCGTYCSFCEKYIGDGNDNHNLDDQQTCLGYYCYNCFEYVGELSDNHTTVGQLTCLGTYCDICEKYVGEGSEEAHVFVEFTCEGDYCDICKQYIGESADHVDGDGNGYCDNCSAFCPGVVGEISLGTTITTAVNSKNDGLVYLKFVPSKTAEYVVYSISDIDSYINVYNRVGNEIDRDDDSGVSYNFRLSMNFVAGEIYYLGLSRYSTVGDITVYLVESCENGIHGEPMFTDCQKYYCSNCALQFNQLSDNHVDKKSYFGFCDVCNTFYPNPSQTITVGDYVFDVPFHDDGALFVEFVPTESGVYVFRAESNCGPYINIASDSGENLYFSNWNPTPLWFLSDNDVYFEIELTAGNVYYVSLRNDVRSGDVAFSVHKACDETHSAETTYCVGYYCDTCSMFVEYENDNHWDINEDEYCDICSKFYLTPDTTISADENITVTVYPETFYVVKFTTEKDGIYQFESESNGDPKVSLYDSKFNLIDSADDYNDLDFVLVAQLDAGSTYYLAIGVYDNSALTFTVSVSRTCIEHTLTGEQTCQGYLCAECNNFYGDALEHDITVANNNPYYHWIECSMCGYYEEAYDHEYDDNRVCECTRQASNGVYVGGILLTDGQYVDTNGNVGTTKPQGGYAYYNDGVLTLNNFDVIVEEEFVKDVGAAIFAERDLVIILEGESILETYCDDVIDVAYGNLTIKGDGYAVLLVSESDDDGIDVACGSLVFESGSVLIHAIDDGIETDANVTVNGGTVYIFCDDEGINVSDNFVITAGMVVINADDDGVDADGEVIVKGGTLIITAYDLGISCTSLYIEGGSVDIASDEDSVSTEIFEMVAGNLIISSYGYGGISSYGVTISGGTIYLKNHSSYGIVSYFDDITITGGNIDVYAVNAAVLALEGAGINIAEGLTDLYITYWSDRITLGDENGFAKHLVIGNEKSFIMNDFVNFGGNCTYLDGVVDMTIEVVDLNKGLELELGVHYTVKPLSGEIEGQGVYYYLISGIGEYIGEVVVSVEIVEIRNAQMGENLLSASDINGVYMGLYSFVALETVRYRFTFFGEGVPFVADENGKLIDITLSVDENGNTYFECNFVKGETYLLLVRISNEYENDFRFMVEYNCEEHVGGNATYTERAVCTVCGSEYGEILVCSDHHGGTATYTELARCVECGVEYGELRECGHLCHKDGLYAIIWDIFQYIYDMLGIETECDCGAAH